VRPPNAQPRDLLPVSGRTTSYRVSRARPPPGAHRRDHRPPERGPGHSTGPQPAHGPRRSRQPVPVP